MTTDTRRRVSEGETGRLAYACGVDIGLARPVNEDQAIACIVPWWDGTDAVIAAVADGLGGEGHGGAAAAIAIAGIEEMAADWTRAGGPADWDGARKGLVEAFGAIDRRIRSLAAAEGHRPGATTLVAAVIAPDGFIHAYTGDSRLYHLSDSRELYRTRDQSLAQVYLDTGRIKSEAEATPRQRNTLFSTLGGAVADPLSIEPEWETIGTGKDLGSAPLTSQPSFRTLVPGDLVLLCTDGLWSVVPPRTLLDPSGDAAAIQRDRLMDAALAGGGPDNIGLVVVRVGGAAQEGDINDRHRKADGAADRKLPPP